MTEPIRCPRCRRAFGGEQAYRRGHRRQGRPRKERCRGIRELRRDTILRMDDAGVWHMRHRDDPGQMWLPLFGRGRPRRHLPKYSVGTRNRHRYVVRPRVPKRPEITVEAA